MFTYINEETYSEIYQDSDIFLELVVFSFMMKDVRKYFLTVSHKLIDKVLNGQRNALVSHGLSDIFMAENEGILDVAWFIYEFIALNIPIKHVHAPGKCNPAMIEMLQEHSAARSGEEEEETVDPRWAALLKLKK